MTGAEQWLGGAALLGVLTACWGKIKLLSWRLVNLLIVRATLFSRVDTAVGYYCWSELKRTPFGEKRFDGNDEFVQPLDRFQAVGFESIGRDTQVFWKGWRPLLIRAGENALEGGGNTGIMTTISFIRGTFDLDDLIVRALDKYNSVMHTGLRGGRYAITRVYGNGPLRGRWIGENGRRGEIPEVASIKNTGQFDNICVDRRYLKWEMAQLGFPRGEGDPFSCLAYPPKVMQVVRRCERWLTSEKWYKDKEISWRLGVLLSGKPGSGKSSLVKAVGRLLDLPIISYDLSSFNNKDFESEWRTMMGKAPCIALLEDIDAVFEGRENRLGEEGGGLTFDCLLNCISGIKEANGVLLFVTTNRPESLDDALGNMDESSGISSRPGRIDITLELDDMDEECRRKLAQRILEDCPDQIDDLVNQGEGLSGAQFTELCTKMALERYWKDEGGVSRNGFSLSYNKGEYCGENKY